MSQTQLLEARLQAHSQAEGSRELRVWRVSNAVAASAGCLRALDQVSAAAYARPTVSAALSCHGRRAVSARCGRAVLPFPPERLIWRLI